MGRPGRGMGTDYGSDIACSTDIEPSLSVVSGTTCLAQALTRRLQTPPGGLFYDPDYGTDLRAFLNGGRDSYAIEHAAEVECLKDERVQHVSASVAFEGDTARLSLFIVGGDGPFVLVLAVSSMTVELLSLSEAA